MSQNRVELIGLKEANRALKKLPDTAKPKIQHVHDVTAFNVYRAASILAPTSRDGSHGHPPGFLRKSIQWASRPRSLSAIVGVAFEAFYWVFLEYGTRKMSAKPFMRPAADANRADHRTRLVDALKRSSAQMAREAKSGG